MNKNTKIKNALISVFDKTGIVDFAKKLIQNNVNLFATSGTTKILNNSGIRSKNISEYTQCPEIMSGRIKTLHHKIYAGILARHENDQKAINNYEIIQMDLVVVNFYPFSEICHKKNMNHNEIIELIDIGGPAMVRAAAKNHNYVTVATQFHDYNRIINEMSINNNSISSKLRLELALSAFQYISNYDYYIAEYFSNLINKPHLNLSLNSLPQYLNFTFKKKQNLVYGENQHQKAGLYVNVFQNSNIIQMQGKPLSYNNVLDSDIATSCVQEFDQQACVIIKHGNPCGVSVSNDQRSAYISAYNTDPISAFGGVIAFNDVLHKRTAETIINKQFVELVIAPDITSAALIIFSKKPNIRILKYCNKYENRNILHLRSLNETVLIQTNNNNCIDTKNWKIVSKRLPSLNETNNAIFALKIVKYLKSNAVIYVRNLKTISIGAGQTSRIDSVKIASMKVQDNITTLEKSIMASDAFFPFKDSIDIVAKQGVSCIIQPGGSIRDAEIISSVDQHKISMIFTQRRYFKH
ncbi:MAG: bifunctional phosphoribosylaminoimidazolecarboxamide formyltransferase/IMP cyclohydrolase [Buchnera aphidicola (Schlechtendalia peitan)]